MQCLSQNCDVSKNSNLQAFPIPDILADKTSHFLRFDYPMKRVPKSPFSGCTSSRYQQQQQIVLNRFEASHLNISGSEASLKKKLPS